MVQADLMGKLIGTSSLSKSEKEFGREQKHSRIIRDIFVSRVLFEKKEMEKERAGCSELWHSQAAFERPVLY